MRALLLAAVALLYVVSIPWYRGPESAADDLLGLPHWVAVALVCYVAAAVLCAWAWLVTEVRDEPPEPPEDA